MKHIMKYACLLLALPVFAACSGDELQQQNDDPVVVVDTTMTEFSTVMPEGDKMFAPGAHKTSLVNDKFVWTLGDDLWVDKDGEEKTFLKNKENSISGEDARASFLFDGEFTKDSYQVYYTGQQNGNRQKSSNQELWVTVKSTQSSVNPGDASHIATDGDCGTAEAKRNGGRYEFNLTHKAAYLKIFPYLASDMPTGIKLHRIEITATDEQGNKVKIAGASKFDKNGLNSEPTYLQEDMITFLCNGNSKQDTKGYEMSYTAEDALSKNGCYVVMWPTSGSNKVSLSVDYYMTDAYNTWFAITREISAREYKANSLTQIRHKLTADFHFQYENTFYMWDAKNWYWHGQDKYPKLSSDPANNNNPKSGDESERYFRQPSTAEYHSYETNRGKNSCKDMPTLYEMAWYLQGDCYYEQYTSKDSYLNPLRGTLWTLDNHVYNGGVWLTKWDKLPNSPKPTDTPPKKYQTASYQWIKTDATKGRPADVTDFFFLPGLGSYTANKRDQFSRKSTAAIDCYYWSSSPSDLNYGIYFAAYSDLKVTESSYSLGYVAGHRPDGSNWFQ